MINTIFSLMGFNPPPPLLTGLLYSTVFMFIGWLLINEALKTSFKIYIFGKNIALPSSPPQIASMCLLIVTSIADSSGGRVKTEARS